MEIVLQKGFWVGWLVLLLLRFIFLSHNMTALRPMADGTVAVQGYIASIPRCHQHVCRFFFDSYAKQHGFSNRWYLTWYGRHAPLNVGQAWFLYCHFRHHRHALPVYFTHWLRSQGAVAAATVEANKAHMILDQPRRYPVLRLRQHIEKIIENKIKQPALAGVIAALTVGSRALLDRPQWSVFQRTGTSHLVAISGLHIGLVAVACYQLIFWLCCRFKGLIIRQPASHWASVGALLSALGYAIIAGMSLPTQRALIMLCAFYLPSLFYRQVPLWRRLCLAWCLMVLLEPLALMQAGFWLSFSAVGLIAYVMRARLRPGSSWRQGVQLHLATSIGLLPLTLFFFEKVSLVMLFSNLLAVPWITVVVVPISLIACLGYGISPCVGGGLFCLAAHLLAPLWYDLQWLSSLHFAVWHHAGLSAAGLLVVSVGVLWLLSPLRWSVRLMGWWYLLILGG